MVVGATSISGSGVTVVRIVSPLSPPPPGLGFTANPPHQFSQLLHWRVSTLWLVFTRSKHGQNATKLDQGGFRLGTSPSIHIYLEVVLFVPFMESI